MSDPGCRSCGGSGWIKAGGQSVRCPGDASAPTAGADAVQYLSRLSLAQQNTQANDYPLLYARLQAFDEVDDADTRSTAVAEARAEFHAWVEKAVFAEEDDSARAVHWDGASRYATTEEGRRALEQIANNLETTPQLRRAAGAMLLEVEQHGEDIRNTWIVAPHEDDSPVPRPRAAIVDADSSVFADDLGRMSPDTQVTGGSKVRRSTTHGDVLISASSVDDSTITRSTVHQSQVADATVTDSTLTGATVYEPTYPRRSSVEVARCPTQVERSTLSPGADVSSAHVSDSTVHGTVVGTGVHTARLFSSEEVGRFYEKYRTPLGEETNYHARPEIGVAAETATHSRVAHSTVGAGSTVRNSHLTYCLVKDGVDTEFAVIESSTLEGTAHIRGEFRHDTQPLVGYKVLHEIIPRDRRARVSNVRLTREYIGPAAEVTRQGHVKSVVKDGVVVTRYRTRFRTGLRRAVWAYTTTRVDPSTGSLQREFAGYDDGVDSSPVVRALSSLF